VRFKAFGCVLTLTAMVFPAASQEHRRVVAISHRGEHLVRPENTLPAFEEAVRVGADFFELDVRTSSDGKLVLSHDSTVDRCTNGTGKVAEMSFEQLQKLDAGARSGSKFAGTRIPTFADALELARGRIGVHVDVKSADAKELVRQIEGHGMTEHVVIYCGLEYAKQIVALNAKLRVMPESNSVEHSKTLIAELHPKVIAFGASDFRADVIATVKEGGAQIYVDRMGATDNPDGWQSAIDDGADGIQTDRPEELVKFLRAKSYK
jgi:glycerophosphoryl diester phosphodiesterase